MKKLIIIVLVIVFVVLLFPIPYALKDGGTMYYDAVLYEVWHYHALMPDDMMWIGWKVEFLGITVFDNVTEVPESEVYG